MVFLQFNGDHISKVFRGKVRHIVGLWGCDRRYNDAISPQSILKCMSILIQHRRTTTMWKFPTYVVNIFAFNSIDLFHPVYVSNNSDLACGIKTKTASKNKNAFLLLKDEGIWISSFPAVNIFAAQIWAAFKTAVTGAIALIAETIWLYPVPTSTFACRSKLRHRAMAALPECSPRWSASKTSRTLCFRRTSQLLSPCVKWAGYSAKSKSA